jgi:hypothetical protein
MSADIVASPEKGRFGGDGREPNKPDAAPFEGLWQYRTLALRMKSDDEFLILASYAKAPGAWWPVGSDDILCPACPAASRLAG